MRKPLQKRAVALPLLLTAAPAMAATDQQQREACYGSSATPDQVIEACGALVRADSNTASLLAQDLANRAFAYRLKGQNDLALADADRAIQLRPDYEFGFNVRGIVHARKGENQYAVADFTRAIGLKPDFADAWFNRANRYRDMGETDKAIYDYTQAIKYAPAFAAHDRDRLLVVQRQPVREDGAVAGQEVVVGTHGGGR